MAEEKKKKRKKKKHRFFWFMIKLQIVLMLVVLGCVGYYYFGGYAEEVQELRDVAVAKVKASDEKTFVPSQTGSIYDANGDLLIELKSEKTSDYVSFEDIPADFVKSVISIEDKRFYSHNGINFKGILRAVKAMIQNGQATQGGSTITMQLAKLTYMEPSKTWQYKVEQMFLALELEKHYSKNKIMEFYLNNIYFANNYYGIEAACHGYFDCELRELDLSQIAFLCAIPNSPSYYDPVTNFDHTMERRNVILRSLLDDGRITQNQYDKAVIESIELNRPKASSEMHNYVDTYVYHCATKALMKKDGFAFRYSFDSEDEEKEYNEEYDQVYADCQKKMYTEGYKIYTSIDMELQDQLQESVDEVLKDFDEKSDDGVYSMQGAAVCIDNETGFVAAIVGGRNQDFSSYTLNRAYQSHRQPGSAIKPLIVYTPCFERGYTPDTMVEDKKIEDGPKNSYSGYLGKIDVRKAVAKSSNTVAWQLYEELTPKTGLSYIRNMNFSKVVSSDEVLATSLGGFTNGVSPVEMASAYATIENDGKYREPTCIRTIIDSDENIIYASDQKSTVIYDANAARMMTDVMQTVMESGTGKKLKLSGMPCAGKTGTTNSRKDGWFVGYTRYYTTSVWVGRDLPKEVKDLSGASYPGQIWYSFMEKIHKDKIKLDFLPYAEMSEEFKEAQEQEKEEARRKKEENSVENDIPDDGNTDTKPADDRQDDGLQADDGQRRDDGEADRQDDTRSNNVREDGQDDDAQDNDVQGNDGQPEITAPVTDDDNPQDTPENPQGEDGE